MHPSGQPDLAGQVAIVTGAARGIGQACAWARASVGADIVTADLGPSEATLSGVRGLGPRGLDVPTDVTQREAVCLLVGRTIAELGRIHPGEQRRHSLPRWRRGHHR